MQIKDLVTFYINETSNTLDITFRLETDSDEEIRNDSILMKYTEEFGYNFLNESEFEDYDDEDLFDVNYDKEFVGEIYEDEVISFLNEYYMINPDKLPPVELF
jgi:hypothetical protein